MWCLYLHSNIWFCHAVKFIPLLLSQCYWDFMWHIFCSTVVSISMFYISKISHIPHKHLIIIFFYNIFVFPVSGIYICSSACKSCSSTLTHTEFPLLQSLLISLLPQITTLCSFSMASVVWNNLNFWGVLYHWPSLIIFVCLPVLALYSASAVHVFCNKEAEN